MTSLSNLNRLVRLDITARQDQYHALLALLVMTVPRHQGTLHYVPLEIILIMQKEYVAHVQVEKCAQILRNSLRYACLF